MDSKGMLKDLFCTGLKAVDARLCTREYIGQIHSEFEKGNYKKLLVIGFGKASCQMAQTAEESLGGLIKEGVVLTKYEHAEQLEKIKVIEAAHPVPDQNGFNGTGEIIRLLEENATEDTLILCLISGGGSALLVAPYGGITLEEKKHVTQLLLRAGADIQELNTVRKHISRVKGGRLAEIAYPATMISFILSDVIGDHLGIIASGPTSPDNSTYEDALKVFEKYNLIQEIPPNVLTLFKEGKEGILPETLKQGSDIFKKTKNIIVANNMKALMAIKEKVVTCGFQPEILSATLSGEASLLGEKLASLAIDTKKGSNKLPKCFISGGETTVTVKGNGLGGRNMELALAFALEISGTVGITMLSAGSDGTDGPTDAAGAFVDGDTVKRAKIQGIAPELYLENNDSYTFFKKTGGLLVTGSTGTNVMDIQIILIEDN